MRSQKPQFLDNAKTSLLPRMTPSSCMELEPKNKFKRELSKSKTKSKTLPVVTTRKSSKRDLLNFKEELESSKLEEPLKLKSKKLRTESPTLLTPQRLLLMRVLLLEVDVLSCTPLKPLIKSRERTSIKTSEYKLLRGPLNFPSEPSSKMLEEKVPS